MEEKHILTSDQKLKFWGYGEWVEEPDLVTFQYEGFDCIVIRIFARETPDHVFGGHLCGYVRIPEGHPFYGKGYDDIPIDVHGGLTYSEIDEENHSYLPDIKGHWIGFDCAHSGDYMPSMEYLNKTVPELIEIQERYKELRRGLPDPFEPIYKNINYCICECKSIVDQLKCEVKK